MFGKKKKAVIALDPQKVSQLLETDLYRLFSQENWAQLDKNSRLMLLQEVENRRARIDGRPPIPVLEGVSPDFKGLPGLYGAFYPDQKVIRVNYRFLEGDGAKHPGMLVLNTILHEGRHAYQRFVIDNRLSVTNTQEVKEWMSSFAHYFSTNERMSQEEKIKVSLFYELQPIEMDARRFARQQLMTMYETFRKQGLNTASLQRQIASDLQRELLMITGIRRFLTMQEINEAEQLVLRAMKERFPDVKVNSLQPFEVARMVLNCPKLNDLDDYMNLIVQMDRLAERKMNRISEEQLSKVSEEQERVGTKRKIDAI